MSNINDILQSVTLKEYLAYANQAVAYRNWEDAYDYWNYIRLNFPQHKEAVYQTARTLYKLQELEEAKLLATEYLEEFPDHYQSEVLLGDIALAQNNSRLAYQLWDSVRTRYPEQVVGYIKLAKLAEDRSSATAIQLWKDIGERFSSFQGVMFKSLVEIYAKHNYWYLAMETASEYVKRHSSDPNSYLLTLSLNLRYVQQHEKLQFENAVYVLFAQCANVLQKFPDNLSLKIFEAKLALHFHDYSTAHDRFEMLANEHPDSLPINTHYAKTLIILGEESKALDILLSQLGNPSAVESGDYIHLLMPLLHNENQDLWLNNLDKLLNLMAYPDAMLVLVTHLEIFDCFEDALFIIELALEYSDDEYKLLYLKAKDRVQNARHVNSAKPYSDIYLEQSSEYPSAYNHLQDDMSRAVDTHQRLIAKISTNNENTYLNANTSAYEIFQITTKIVNAIKSKSAFSLVRPEGHFLPYRGGDKQHYEVDRSQHEKELWNGNQFVNFDLYEQALSNADIIGIPEQYHESYLDDSDLRIHRRFRAILSWMTEQHFDDSTVTSSQISHDLQIWGLYDFIFSHLDSVSIVTNTSINDKLMYLFGIGTRIEYLIPHDYNMQTPFDPQPTTIHYPEEFNTILSNINVSSPGEVFLVSAGVLSPIYCEAIKQQGGIALDIGETLNLWNGEKSSVDNINPEILPFYRLHRTSLWWQYLNSVTNIPFQKLLNNRAKTYWINLSHRIDRRISAASNLNRLNIPHQRIEAITPNNLPEFSMRSEQLNLLDVEKACLASHLVALDTGIANGDETFFVQEDDLHELVPIDYDEVMMTAPKEWDVLQIHTHGIEALQHNYLAYLSGHMWLPWHWRNPSTALYLTNAMGAKKILNTMEYNDLQSVNLQSLNPSLPVADRALYKDFQTFAITYPFGVTDGGESDILNVNSFRHVNASKQSKRFHTMTHTYNPQLRFNHMNTTTIKNEDNKNIVMGLGTGQIGFLELRCLLNQQDSSFISYQMGSHPYRFPSWQDDINKVLAIINYILEIRDCEYVGDMMSAYLPYVEALISIDPTVKFVCLYSTMDAEVESLLSVDPHTNIFQEHQGISYQYNQIYDRSVGKSDSRMTKIDAVRNYVEMYAEESSRLENQYPSNFRRIDTNNLNDEDKVISLLTWIGYPNSKISQIHSQDSTHSLNIPNYDEIVSRTDETDLYQFLEKEQHSNNLQISSYIDPHLYEICIYQGQAEGKEFINFVDENSALGDVVLQIDFRRSNNLIVLNNYLNTSWGNEKHIHHTYSKDVIIFAYYDILFHCIYLLDERKQHFFTFELHSAHQITDARVFGRKLRLSSPLKKFRIRNLWRFSDQTSGFDALSTTLKQSTPELKQGLSMIIRAKNEEASIEKCLTTILPHVDEVIFVDNGSTDQTRLIAERLQQKYFNLKVYSYPIQIPRIGLEHCQAVLNQSTNTLGHYYNWCLAQSTLINFAKWDADYICIEENFVEMINQFQLRTRGDNFALWFSGLELYTDGERYWVDSNSLHNEYRIFSRKHGAYWVNLPPWEEIEQSYLYRAHKLFYEKPIYIEIFRLDEIEFKDRGIFTGNKRDAERMEYIHQFKENGDVPKSFVEVMGVDDPQLKDMPLSTFEIQDMRRANKMFNSIPTITHRMSEETQVKLGTQEIPNVFTVIMSCRPNRDKQQIQRKTWVKDMKRAGFSYAFAEGEIGRPDCMVNDRLLLNCRDEYEFLASKTLAIVKWVYYNTNFDYLLKVDDDVILNPSKLAQFEYSHYDYIGGRLIYDVFDPLWHTNKTWNEQLSRMYCQIDGITPYYGGQFSYFLSRRAMKVLIDNSHELTTQLYEDFGVAKALRLGGIKPTPNNTKWKSRNYEEWRIEPRFNIDCISDIPVDKMEEVYEIWSNSSEWLRDTQIFNNDYEVKFDWMDVHHVISQLQSQ
jgi:hypothetical protein